MSDSLLVKQLRIQIQDLKDMVQDLERFNDKLEAKLRMFGGVVAGDSSYDSMPVTTKQTIDDYVSHGLQPGSFTTSMLANDLMGAFGRADVFNRSAIFEIASYIYNEIPKACHGSYEAVDRWLDKKRSSACAE